MKIQVFEAEPWECPTFEALQQKHEVQCAEGPLRAGNAGAYSDADIISTFIYSKLGRDVLEQFDNLRMIATRSTGFDHIDLEYCREHNICISNVPTYGQNTVAEHVFGLLLTISHKLDRAVDRTRRGDFTQQGLQGFDLEGKTLGVVGTGDIGRYVIRIATGFNMKVLAYDVAPDEDAARELGFEYADLDALLGRSDIVTLHVPANEKTRHLISDREIGLMKDGAVIINTSRGSVLDIQALVRALADGKIAAAGLDVLPEEPIVREEAELLRSVFRKEHNLESLLADHIVLRMRNVVVTPHSAFNTREAVRRILDTTVANIQSFLAGEPRNAVGK